MKKGTNAPLSDSGNNLKVVWNYQRERMCPSDRAMEPTINNMNLMSQDELAVMKLNTLLLEMRSDFLSSVQRESLNGSPFGSGFLSQGSNGNLLEGRPFATLPGKRTSFGAGGAGLKKRERKLSDSSIVGERISPGDDENPPVKDDVVEKLDGLLGQLEEIGETGSVLRPDQKLKKLDTLLERLGALQKKHNLPPSTVMKLQERGLEPADLVNRELESKDLEPKYATVNKSMKKKGGAAKRTCSPKFKALKLDSDSSVRSMQSIHKIFAANRLTDQQIQRQNNDDDVSQNDDDLSQKYTIYNRHRNDSTSTTATRTTTTKDADYATIGDDSKVDDDDGIDTTEMLTDDSISYDNRHHEPIRRRRRHSTASSTSTTTYNDERYILDDATKYPWPDNCHHHSNRYSRRRTSSDSIALPHHGSRVRKYPSDGAIHDVQDPTSSKQHDTLCRRLRTLEASVGITLKKKLHFFVKRKMDSMNVGGCVYCMYAFYEKQNWEAEDKGESQKVAELGCGSTRDPFIMLPFSRHLST